MKTVDTTKLGWHWLSRDKKLCYRDDREVVVGEKLHFLIGGRSPDINYTPTLCRSGMHASPTPAHGLKYAASTLLSRVIVYDVNPDSSAFDKFVGKARTVVEIQDTRKALINIRLELLDLLAEHYSKRRDLLKRVRAARSYAARSPTKQDRNKLRSYTYYASEQLGYCGSAIKIEYIQDVLSRINHIPSYTKRAHDIINKELRALFIV